MKKNVARIIGEDELNRQPRQAGEDLKDYPTYSIPEAAIIIGMKRRTLQRWVYARPYFEVAGADFPRYLLSFKDLAQYYFLHFVRKHAGLTDRSACDLLAYAKILTRSQYPLLHGDIKVLFRRVLLDSPARAGEKRLIVNLVAPRRGQYVFDEVVDMFATRISKDARGRLVAIHPWRLYKRGDNRQPVEVHPHVMSGRLVVTGTRIPVQAVAARRKAGEALKDIAKDYGLSQETVRQSLRHIGLRKAA